MTPVETISVEFDPLSIPDEALVELRRLGIGRMMDDAPRMGSWLHAWADREQARRREENREPTKHDLAAPDFDRWTNAELGQALVALTVWSYAARDEDVGRLADRLAIMVAAVVARRLGWKPQRF